MPAVSRHRQNILSATIRLLRRQGYVATGLNDILKSSGAPKGSLYHYFPQGKEQLGAEAVTLAGKTVTATLNKLVDNTNTAHEFFDRYCEQLAYWVEQSNFAEGCPITTTLLEMASNSPLIAKAGSDAFASWKAVFTRVLVRDGWEPAAAQQHTNILLSALQGALLISRVERDTAALKNVSSVLARLQEHTIPNEARLQPQK